MAIKEILFFACLSLTTSIDVNKDKEFSSFFPKPDPNFDITWFSPSKKLYLPFMSRLSLNRIASIFLTPEDMRTMSLGNLTETHCTLLEVSAKDKVAWAQAFEKPQLEFPVNIDAVLPGRWDVISPDHPSHLMMTEYIVLLDKKNGALFVQQWMDGTKSFNLKTPIGVKPSKAFIKIAATLMEEEYDFDPNLFVISDYKKC